MCYHSTLDEKLSYSWGQICKLCDVSAEAHTASYGLDFVQGKTIVIIMTLHGLQIRPQEWDNFSSGFAPGFAKINYTMLISITSTSFYNISKFL